MLFSHSTKLHAFPLSVVNARADPEGGGSPALKTMKVTIFTMIVYNSENSIRDIRLFCRKYCSFATAVL